MGNLGQREKWGERFCRVQEEFLKSRALSPLLPLAYVQLLFCFVLFFISPVSPSLYVPDFSILFLHPSFSRAFLGTSVLYPITHPPTTHLQGRHFGTLNILMEDSPPPHVSARKSLQDPLASGI